MCSGHFERLVAWNNTIIVFYHSLSISLVRQWIHDAGILATIHRKSSTRFQLAFLMWSQLVIEFTRVALNGYRFAFRKLQLLHKRFQELQSFWCWCPRFVFVSVPLATTFNPTTIHHSVDYCFVAIVLTPNRVGTDDGGFQNCQRLTSLEFHQFTKIRDSTFLQCILAMYSVLCMLLKTFQNGN
jgi:hypothetical protein